MMTGYSEKGYYLGETQSGHDMFEYIRIVAPTKMSVLIAGERGTEKECITRPVALRMS